MPRLRCIIISSMPAAKKKKPARTSRTRSNHAGYIADHPRGLLILYSISWLFVLAGLYWAYFVAVQHHVAIVASVPRVLLVGTGAGMLGAVAVNFYGITSHRYEKDSRFNKWDLWYLSRPFNGAIVGLMTYALLRFISTAEPTIPAVTAAAFLFGMQESRFLQLLKKIGDIVINTSKQKKC
jgi:hypothetical protein